MSAWPVDQWQCVTSDSAWPETLNISTMHDILVLDKAKIEAKYLFKYIKAENFNPLLGPIISSGNQAELPRYAGHLAGT